ncbi:30S ribosomal protein S4e [Candidatus Woesearchaeota archaeon]|nr:30S ribosomal protein S4e [Candidatus Woesearchaeota archaeon]
MKNHLKRISSPKTWDINKKEVFVVRPKSSGHPWEYGMPLGVLIRDNFKFANTMDEVKKLLLGNNVMVDGKRRTDHRFLVGLFDVVHFVNLKKFYRISFDLKGRVAAEEITASDAAHKLCRVKGKTAVPGGKIQYHLHDGKNLFLEQKMGVGGTILLELPSMNVKTVLELKPGAQVLLIKGKHLGDIGTLKEIRGKEAVYIKDGQEVETAKDYLFVVDKKFLPKGIVSKNDSN